ncbi:metallopeptidase TldD-related protein [Candidatus Avelusimicrobium stercoris]|uniref:metallopeptidase TldD-related protein n=1 Tax=Candidatus Avelusimicrobium stercoris TaxID=1947924 RepID=UPI003D0966A0
MKKTIVMSLFLLFGLSAFAQNNCKIADELPIKLMSAEIKRGFKTFKKQNPPLYYLSYQYYTSDFSRISVAEEAASSDRRGLQRTQLTVLPRVGSPALDNTRRLTAMSSVDDRLTREEMPAISGDGKAFSTALWRATDAAVKKAQEDLDGVKAEKLTAPKRFDDSPDFAYPPVEHFCRTTEFATFDYDKIKAMLVKASALTKGKKFILDSDFSFEREVGYRYFVDSRGTQLKTPQQEVRLSYIVSGKTENGQEVSRYEGYDVLRPEELPSEEKLLADVRKSIDELEQLVNAPEGEPLEAPTLLKGRAMAVFVHEVLGHRMEGHRQKMEDFGRTFTDKIGQQVVSPILTIVDDATLAYFNGEPMRGFYEYDEEGVKARPVTLVEKGVLKNFLMSSSPIKNFPASNGHGRGDSYNRPVARMAVTRVIAEETVPYEELEQKFLQEIKRQNKPYGFMIEDLSGGFTMTETYLPQSFKLEPTLMYRVYPDGRKEVVRGLDMVGTPQVSFNKVLGAANDYKVFNGSCGAESGWVPVSGIAPSVLLESMEMEKKSKSTEKPPLLPPPYSLNKGVSK